MSESQGGEGGTVEDRSEIQDDRDLARLWLDQLALAHKEEEDWRDRARSVLNVFRSQKMDKGSKAPYRKSLFNILYSNTEIMIPAVFNSEPVPDVRERWGDGDPVAKEAAQILNRALTYTIEGGKMGQAASAATSDMLLQGRGVIRVDFQPPAEDGSSPEQIDYRLVQWDDFRRGPGKSWDDVSWVAFRHYMTREEVRQVNPEAAEEINLETELAGVDRPEGRDGKPVADVFKRAEVWEIWDRDTKQVLYMAQSWPDAPLKVLEDPYTLEDFFPCPEPVYAVRSTDTLVPVELYSYYNELAAELDDLTRRIRALTRTLRLRGFYADANAGEVLERLAGAKDGELVPVQNAAQIMSGGGMDKLVYWMPIKEVADTLAALIVQRDSVKQTIYEITGVSDVLRGASNAEETATAQQIKANWGSLRVSKAQNEVARLCRDLMRIASEIMAEQFSPETLMAMTGVQPKSPGVFDLLKNDTLRRFRVDVETDSTIRADLQRQQQNAGQFIQGMGSFFQAVAPAVQAGFPVQAAAELFSALARPFRLGKSVEEMLDQLPQMMAQQAQMAAQQPQAPPEDKNAQHQASLQQDMEKHKLTLQHQAQVEKMKAQAAQPPDAQMLQGAVEAIASAVQQITQVQAASIQTGQQQAEAMMQSADAMAQAAQAALQPKALQRDAGGGVAAMVPVGGEV